MLTDEREYIILRNEYVKASWRILEGVRMKKEGTLSPLGVLVSIGNCT